MLIEHFTTMENVEKIAEFLSVVKPQTAYLAIPTRPPAEKNVRGSSIDFILEAKRIFDKYTNAELLIDFEKGEFAIKSREDVLSIASVHPLREDILVRYLRKLNLRIEDLVDELEKVEFNGERYYRKKFSGTPTL